MMEQREIRIRALSPLVLTDTNDAGSVMTATKSIVSGTVLRGVLAEQYISCRRLGKDAAEDERFLHLFFGGLRFVDAYPISKGRRTFSLPLSLMSDKGKTKVVDFLKNPNDDKTGMKGIDALGYVWEKFLKEADVAKNIEFHMSRGSNEERIAGRSRDGKIYSYEQISAGQEFSGAVIGEKDALDELAEAIETREFHCRLGRSKYTQYGKCSLSIGESLPLESVGTEAVQKAGAGKEYLTLRLETPYIPRTPAVRDAAGFPYRAESMLEELTERLNAGKPQAIFFLEGKRIIARATYVDNFVGIWNMKRPREFALRAGSVFQIGKCGAWTSEDLVLVQQIAYSGLGRRTEEGFGQLRFWTETPTSFEKSSKCVEEVTSESTPYVIQSDKTKKLVANILHRRTAEKLRVRAAADAVSLEKTGLKAQEQKNASAHFFAELDELLLSTQKKENSDAVTFSQILMESLAGHSGRKDTLHRLTLHDKTLFEWLIEKHSIPFATEWEDSWQALRDEIGCRREEETNEFYTYWHAFFHHARKQSAGNRRVTI